MRLLLPPGCLFWALDYSGLELHIAAALSGDPEMLRVLRETCPAPGPDGCEHSPKHGDLHDAFRQAILKATGVDVGRVTAKSGNFEQLYGGMASQLVTILAIERAHVTQKMAQLTVDTHHAVHATYHAYTEGIVQAAKLNGGWSASLAGRRRYEQDIFSNDPERRGWAERALVNMTIQGTAADILKKAMVLVMPVLRKYDAHMTMQVHDELDGFVPEEQAAGFIPAMQKVLQGIAIPGLTLKAEGGAGMDWSTVH